MAETLHESGPGRPMRRRFRAVVCGVLSAIAVPLASAADTFGTTGEGAFWSIQLENDVFSSSGDRYYTHGTQISRAVLGEPPRWLQNMARLFPAFESDGILQGVNYTLGQKIFTPDDTRATGLVANDRPYAGYLYMSAGVLSRVSSGNHVDSGNVFELTLGVVGPSALAAEVQTGYHDFIGIESPRGWDHQLSDEPALGVTYSRFWRYIEPLGGTLEYGITPHVNVALGNVYTYAASGAMVRIGTHLDNDLAPPNIRPGFPGLSIFKSGRQNNWYLYAGIEGRAVARNIFLDGNSFRESHRVDKRALVGDFQYGIVLQTGGVRISLSNMLRTREFEGQKQNTNFGAINLSFSM